jgi:threonine dehydratase
MRFLTGLGERFNITMFHYRNHGAAWGRVLVGFEAEAREQRELKSLLQSIGYRYWEETGNTAYQMFLR